MFRNPNNARDEYHNSRTFGIVLHYAFVRLLRIEYEYVQRLDDLLEWHRNPIDFYFQTALMNSRLRRRHVRQAIGEQWAK